MDAATSPLAKTREKSRQKRWESPIAGYLFISPWLIGFFTLTIYPMIQSLYYSFTDFSLLEEPNWVGIRNYQRILTTDDKFVQSVKVTFTYVLTSVPLRLVAALLIAMLLVKSVRGMSVYRTAIYFPSLIGSSIAVSILWRNIFGKDGYINHLLSYVGIDGPGWVTDPDTALGTLVLLVVWQFGSAMVIFLAGLKQIPHDLYEASSVDGAGKLRQFFNITLPMLTPTIYFNLIMGIISSFQMFTPAMIITHGGPVNSTYAYALYLYERGFGQLQMGYASGLAWIMLLLIAASTSIIFFTSKYWVFYETEGGKKR
ncbi:carbohydrate ABC transporter permease [Paenibacillus thalictri]|uniref:Sugar ABC transporter permease n=1 Tax=Paenibacillus thalictri TaxID=2527873 RepID=A0A4Q9DGX1_9BACL|nr:sugar ABC transporter permease [Paenibacillus thalictri]TBL70083.1 sugar ABC transporter permease [Paenibacillus thalictri]